MPRPRRLKRFGGNAMPRKRADINLDELEKLAVMQATDEEIAQWFKVSQKTIQRRKRTSAEFRRIIEAGRAKGRISVRRHLLELSKTSVPAAIFLAKNVLGDQNASASPSLAPRPRT